MDRRRKLISTSDSRWRRKDPLPSILEEWYGSETGSSETVSHLPEPVTIQEVLGNLMNAGGCTGDLFVRIRDGWEDIVGKDITDVSAPKSLKDGILYVGVSNSTWLMELRNYSRKMIVEKLAGKYGKDAVKDIVFVPAG